ncbi:NUDIX hydrolase [Alysiella crassa]|uniref:GDP-mannose pyrophosphatase n=1 Tax=Alysiella crassa TaxID=153491 RepID=A0A376BMB5_9NEIS|nr:NUDIX hydrolase [Alysiella crassa]UOP06956.1 NUDIX hydrolase [Alysiella crassa]SSY70907.1 ADP-ribose pyrophosphatase [Alysiella crassa]
MNLEEKQISSNTLFEGSFLNIHQDQILLPNGNQTQRVVVRHSGATCVLAVTDDERVVLVRQWRYAAGRALLEVPAGKLDAGEDPAECALRELAEETPYVAERVEYILKFYTAPGFCDEVIHLYRAVNIRPNSTLSPDQDEFVETVLLNREQARAAVENGEICDGKTLIALQYWFNE